MTAIVAKKKNAFNRLVTFGVILFSDCMIYSDPSSYNVFVVDELATQPTTAQTCVL